MSSFDLFDPGAAGAWQDPPPVAKCSPTVAAPPMAEEPPEMAEMRGPEPEPAETVATVATVAECRAGIALLASLPCPWAVSGSEFRQLVTDAQMFDRLWLEEALGLGWSLLDIFGCNPVPFPLARRIDRDGLVVSLGGRHLKSLDAGGASIQDRGNVLRFYRGFDRAGAVPIWVAFSTASATSNPFSAD